MMKQIGILAALTEGPCLDNQASIPVCYEGLWEWCSVVSESTLSSVVNLWSHPIPGVEAMSRASNQ